MNDNPKNIWMAIAVVLAALILGSCFIIGITMLTSTINNKEIIISDKSLDKLTVAIQSLRQNQVMPQPKMPQLGEKKVENAGVGATPIRGKSSAKVLMIEFSDFQCPFSKRFYSGSFPQLQKDYIDTGKVKFAYRDYPLGFHPHAKPAAIASRCADKQGKFWQMYDKLMSNNVVDQESIKRYSQEIGLNSASFEKCLADSSVAKAVDKDMEEANKLGVQGTPAFFINGRFIEGAYPYEVFKKIIDEELSGKK